jgi:hypothetical protein
MPVYKIQITHGYAAALSPRDGTPDLVLCRLHCLPKRDGSCTQFMSLVSEKVTCVDADLVVVNEGRDSHRPTLTLTDMFGAVDQSLHSDNFSPSPLAMSCEGLGLVWPHIISHQRDTCKEAVARWGKEWHDAPYVLGLFHPSPEFTKGFV